MNFTKCQKCGADCAEGTSFCRQCGAPIDTASATAPSEHATALLDRSVDGATQRFDARPTAPDPVQISPPTERRVESRSGSRRGVLIGALVIVVIGVICVATLIGMKRRSEATANLVYPGATTVVDMTGEHGGRALHLETSDAFSNVAAWYQKKLRPEKTMRLTSTSVVLKNQKTTATIASEGAKTSILIKITP